MPAPSKQLALTFPVFPSSSNIESKPRPVHSSDCSLRPPKNIIRIKEDWWGLPVNDFAVMPIQEERGTELGNKRRRSNATARTGAGYYEESTYAGIMEELDSAQPCNDSISSNPQNTSRRIPRLPSVSESKSSRVYSTSSSFASRARNQYSRASRSHPWLSSRPALPPLRRSPTPPLMPLRAATFVLSTPIAVMQEQNQHVFKDYEPFLTQQAIEPSFSLSFYRNQIDFFTSVSPPINWAKQVGSKIFKHPSWPTLSEKVMNLEPNFVLIRQRYPLKRSITNPNQTQKDHSDWEGIRKVLEWIYGRKLRFEEYLWFVENVSLPLLALVKIHSSTQGYARGIWGVSCQFEDYLDKSPSSRLSSVEVRARELLDWLRNGVSQGKRSARWRNWWRDEVYRERDGKTAKGNYWLKEIEGLRSIRDLERWEDDMKTANRWRRD